MFRWLLSEGHHHEDEDHAGDEGGGALSFLLYNCAAMFLGAFFVGMLPLMMDLGEGRLKVLSIFSAGLMVRKWGREHACLAWSACFSSHQSPTSPILSSPRVRVPFPFPPPPPRA